VKLNAEFPDKYKDPDHKPKMFVVLSDTFIACYGFAASKTIKDNISENPVLAELFPLPNDNDIIDPSYLRSTVIKIFM